MIPLCYHFPVTVSGEVEFRDVFFRYPGGADVFRGLSFALARGRTLALLGRSGGGKTTALRLINALLVPDAGEVVVAGKNTRDCDPIGLRRGTGYVIQEAGLIPHFTVARNIAMVPRLLGWPEDRITARVHELLSLLGLSPDGFAPRFPRELSGGERQRVGIARALAGDAPLILMDEPFSALDPVIASGLRRDFLALSRKLGKTVILVTHDLISAIELADAIVLLFNGGSAFFGTAAQFFTSSHPEVITYRDTLPRVLTGNLTATGSGA